MFVLMTTVKAFLLLVSSLTYIHNQLKNMKTRRYEEERKGTEN